MAPAPVEVAEQPGSGPRRVVKLAVVSLGPASESHNGSLVSVLSLTCLRPSSASAWRTHTAVRNTTNPVCNTRPDTCSCPLLVAGKNDHDILPPHSGGPYRCGYRTNGPLISPPSEPVIIDIVRELVVYSLSPTAVILSWQRPYHVAFRKYVLQTFFFNPVTLASEWTTYYEIAATASVIASV
ncbi:unnamed protein product, partial [Coregonus sp. 'balchen']